MNRDEVREIVQETVRETLIAIGVDQKDPLAVQQDLAWLRQLRLAAASARGKAAAAMIGILLTAAAAALWTGVRSFLGGGR